MGVCVSLPNDVLMAPQPMKEHVKHIRKLPLHLQDVG